MRRRPSGRYTPRVAPPSPVTQVLVVKLKRPDVKHTTTLTTSSGPPIPCRGAASQSNRTTVAHRIAEPRHLTAVSVPLGAPIPYGLL